jgi:hypothetical protein
MGWWEPLFVVRLLDYLSKIGTNIVPEFNLAGEKRPQTQERWQGLGKKSHGLKEKVNLLCCSHVTAWVASTFGQSRFSVCLV